MNLSILSLVFLFLAGCKNYEPKIPLQFVYVLDLKNQACAKKKIVKNNPIKFEHVEDLALNAGGPCDGAVAISRFEWLDFKHFIEQLLDKYDESYSLKPDGN